jgi:hypothetical protein
LYGTSLDPSNLVKVLYRQVHPKNYSSQSSSSSASRKESIAVTARIK